MSRAAAQQHGIELGQDRGRIDHGRAAVPGTERRVADDVIGPEFDALGTHLFDTRTGKPVRRIDAEVCASMIPSGCFAYVRAPKPNSTNSRGS